MLRRVLLGAILGLGLMPAAWASELGSVGSGILLSRSGPLLTDAHVVEACSRVWVKLPDRSRILGKVIQMDPQSDMVLMNIPIDGGLTLHLRKGPDNKEPVWLSGFPHGIEQLQTYSAVAGAAGDRTAKDAFPIYGPVEPGDSGGPVFDQAGNLVGMVFGGGTKEAGGYAMEGWRIEQFLAQAGIHLPSGDGIRPQSDKTILARASLITLEVDCERDSASARGQHG